MRAPRNALRRSRQAFRDTERAIDLQPRSAARLASARRNSEDDFHRMIHHVNLAHGAAVDVLRDNVSGASIGCIHSCQPCRPSSGSEADAEAAARLDIYWNNAFPDPQCRGEYPALVRPAIEPARPAAATSRASSVRSTGSGSITTARSTSKRTRPRCWVTTSARSRPARL